MERDRGDQDAACDQFGHELGRERPSGARHLGAARLEGKNRLVSVEGPFGRARSRSGSGGRGGTGTARAARQGRAGRPPAAGRLRTVRATRRGRRRAARPRCRRAGQAAASRRRRGARRARCRRARVWRDGARPCVRASSAGSAAGQRRRGVDDEQVASREEARQVVEARVDQGSVVSAGDEHRDVVASRASGFGRLVRLAHPDRRDRVHTRAACRAAAR